MVVRGKRDALGGCAVGIRRADPLLIKVITALSALIMYMLPLVVARDDVVIIGYVRPGPVPSDKLKIRCTT